MYKLIFLPRQLRRRFRLQDQPLEHFYAGFWLSVISDRAQLKQRFITLHLEINTKALLAP